MEVKMCPFCFATVGLVVAGTVSTGGLTALAVKVSRKKNQEAETNSNAKERSSENVNPHSR
jgi:hypothetical protein